MSMIDMSAFEKIAELISYTNNGKLMIVNALSQGLTKNEIQGMINVGFLKPATFMEYGDSVTLGR